VGAVTTADRGAVRRVNGPLVEVEGLADVAMSDVVELGPDRLPGEVVAVRGQVATVQSYEYTGGLRPGDTARSLGLPLSVPLGPGLLGGVFDGLLRPLDTAPTWLAPGATRHSSTDRPWAFTPTVRVGDAVSAGTRLGTVGGAGALEHRVQVPPGLGGPVDWVAPAGAYGADDTVARIGGTEVRVTSPWPVRRPRPAAERLDAQVPLTTGQRVLDLLFPVGRGSTVAVPGGFGTGKTVLLQQVAKWCDADVIVYVGCGERGNEMADVLDELSTLDDPRTGGRLAARTVIIANTSNMPMMARETSIYTGVTVAEYYRDMGYDVVVIADSTSRWAEALREFASRAGALPAEEGYPATLASALASFYERAGRVQTLGGEQGSVTILGAVSPAGGDLTEPVTSHTQRFVRCVWSLDRDLAYARHYPAVSWAGSFSRDAEALSSWHADHGDPGWAGRRSRMVGLLAEADRLAALAELVGVGALPGHERVVLLAGRLLREAVLQQSALDANDAFCSAAKGSALLDAVLEVVARCDALVARGVPATVVEEQDFTELLRAAPETAAGDVDGVARQAATVLARLAAVP
jgi:V/A-type H+-transporting ATPase subunit A